MFHHILIATLMVFCAIPLRAEEQSPVDPWQTYIKDYYFKGKKLIEDKTVIELVTPYRSEDAALTPVSINAKFPQTPERYIESIYVFVDKNPQPLVGTFHLTPDIGKADLAMRVRIDEYTHVRAIAVLNNGEHHMTANFVKASGGCSAPPAADLKAAMQRLGQMKFRTVGEGAAGQPTAGQFMVSHPNLTGLQLDQRTRAIIPPHYVKKIAITYNGKPVMTAEVGIALSTDPSLRFFFKPEKAGTIKAEVVDSKDMQWSETFEVAM
jgi:sulfur-oxidizing protein SoxY